ncbi:MAG: preprotein translocase subunit SecE [Bacilli bacterium]|nr:preprotein translocase subunit SecE [Bacilli bacterium]
MKRLVRFLVSVKKEIPKIKWPSKKEMIKLSISTLFIVFIFVVFFGGLDLLLGAIKMVIR